MSAQSLIGAPCSRCTAVYVGRGEWNCTFKAGVAVGLLCPNCQTVEENTEAEINLATLTYDRDNAGRVVGRAR